MIDQEKIKQAVRLLLEGIGEDPSREGLVETPERIARMYEEIYGGLTEDAGVHLAKTFTVEHSEMVLEKDITFYSTCEHHLLPFYGKAHIAYIPDGRCRSQQTGTDCGSLREKTADPGAAYRADRRCVGEISGAKRGYGNDRSRTYVYDDARDQKAGKQDGNGGKTRCICRGGSFAEYIFQNAFVKE